MAGYFHQMAIGDGCAKGARRGPCSGGKEGRTAHTHTHTRTYAHAQARHIYDTSNPAPGTTSGYTESTSPGVCIPPATQKNAFPASSASLIPEKPQEWSYPKVGLLWWAHPYSSSSAPIYFLRPKTMVSYTHIIAFAQ